MGTPGTSGVAVGKAWKDSDTATAGGLAAAGGIGTVKVGAEMERRARKAPLDEAKRAKMLADRANAANAHAIAGKGKKPEKVTLRGVVRGEHSIAQQREWTKRTYDAAHASRRRAGALQRVMPAKVLGARRVKAGGLGLAAIGTAVGLKGLANQNRNRQMGY